MTINTLFFADFDLTNSDPDTKLLTTDSLYFAITDKSSSNYITSYQDTSFEYLKIAFDNCQHLDISKFNLGNINDNWVQGKITRLLFEYQNKLVQSLNFNSLNLNAVSTLLQVRNNNSPTLWTSGCSITAGEGVKKDENYPNLLGEKLNMPLINLAMNGGSNLRAVDQLLRSDIQENDIVILGITNFARFETTVFPNIWTEHTRTLDRALRLPLDGVTLDYFSSHDLARRNITAILQLINFCSKIRTKLILVNLLDCTWSTVFFHQFDFYVDCANTNVDFIDLGSDNLHPGPLQHQKYADIIFEKISWQRVKESNLQ